MITVTGVRFRNTGKVYYFDPGKHTDLKAGTGVGGSRRGAGGDDGPDSGDLSDPGLWTAVMLLSGLALGGVLLGSRKARRAGR